MARYQPKTVATENSVEDFLASIDDESKRADARILVRLMSETTGEPPQLWGSMIGFGRYHYRYESGHEGDRFLVGFAPRKDSFSIYLMGSYLPEEAARREALLAQLGKHRMGKACLYVRRLGDIEIEVLQRLVEASAAELRKRYPTG